MSKDPAFLFYPNDYIGGTMGMTFEEKGAYMELLMMQFNRGHMTTHMIGQTIGQLWDTVKVKFIQDDKGAWYNKRLEDEQMKRKNFTESRRNNVSGTNQHSKKHSKQSGHMTSHMENEDEYVNRSKTINIEFEYFWNLYDKKVGDKSKIEKKWMNLSDKNRMLAINHIKLYVLSTPDKQYRKNPETYLNQSGWESEIIKPTDQKKTEPTGRNESQVIPEGYGERGPKDIQMPESLKNRRDKIGKE